MADANWEVTYPDNKTLNAKLQMGSLLGGPEGAMSIDDLMGKMYAWKMRALEDARNMVPRAPRPAPTLSQATKTPYVPERMPLRDLMQTNELLNSRFYSPNGIHWNSQMENLQNAANLTGQKYADGNGWDRLANLYQATGSRIPPQDPRAKPEAEAMDRNNTYMNSLRMYRPDDYMAMMAPRQKQGDR